MVIAAAQDTGGEAAAGEFIDMANTTYVNVIDQAHTISSLYNLVNVPSAVWIDEQGQIVRIDEGTYADKHNLSGFEFGRDDYGDLVRDWVLNGADSEHVKRPDARQHLRQATEAEALAQANFKLGVYFQQQGERARAIDYFDAAATLNPDSWNYHRQNWIFDGEDAARENWRERVQARADKAYYQPIAGLDK